MKPHMHTAMYRNMTAKRLRSVGHVGASVSATDSFDAVTSETDAADPHKEDDSAHSRPNPPLRHKHRRDSKAVQAKQPWTAARKKRVGAINRKALSALHKRLESYAGEDLVAADWARLFTELEAEGHDMSRPLIDVRL